MPNIYIVETTETRDVQVEYLVEAETREAAFNLVDQHDHEAIRSIGITNIEPFDPRQHVQYIEGVVLSH